MTDPRLVPVVPAATVVLLREGASGPEVFLVRRHRRSGFLPDVWVFPGGRVEPSDRDVPADRARGGLAALAALGLDDRGLLVGAARETFEEAGVWLGEGSPDAVARHALARGQVALADVLATTDATLDLDRLRPWARWITPVSEPRRFDTVFLVAATDGSGAAHDAHETVDSAWVAPAEALAARERFPMAPPTWWTLGELARWPSVAQVLSAPRALDPVRPDLDLHAGTFAINLPGHPTHAEPRRPDLPTRIALGAEGWFAEP